MCFRTKVSLLMLALFIGAGVFSMSVQPAEAASLAELQQYIEQLKIQIAELQAKLKLAQQQQSTEWCHDFNTNLRYKDTGVEVIALQTALKKHGFSEVDEDVSGNFGTGTFSAVVYFQEKYANDILSYWGLTRGTGFVGKTTRDKLNEFYGCDTTPTPPIEQCAKEGEQVNRNPLMGPTDMQCCEGLVENRVSRSYSICEKPAESECTIGEIKKHTCPDGTQVPWCTCINEAYGIGTGSGWACIDSPENRCSTASGCTDSDGGINKYVKGTTCRDLYSLDTPSSFSPDRFCRTDRCLPIPLPDESGTSVQGYLTGDLTEYYCSNNKIFSRTMYCENGCLNGACVRESEEKLTCVAKCQAKGYDFGVCRMSCYTGEVNIGYLSSCNPPCPPGMACPAVEYHCCCQKEAQEDCRDENYGCSIDDKPCCPGLKSSALYGDPNGDCSEVANCGTICIPCGNGVCDANEGKCNCPQDCAESECTIGDEKKHTCPDGTQVPWCTCINEAYGIGTGAGWACIDSPENKCASSTTCTDTDGGVNQYVRGTACRPSTVHDGLFCRTDRCIPSPDGYTGTDMQGYLTEYYCKDSKMFSKTIHCADGCVNGACNGEQEECVKEGETYMPGEDKQCCSGLRAMSITQGDGVNCTLPMGYVCTAFCGNGECEGEYENACSCPEDCKETECVVGEEKKHTCPDGTQVPWCVCGNDGFWECVNSPENACPVEASITVISPNGGEIWTIGETRDIIWNSTGIDEVGIEWEICDSDGNRIESENIILDATASIGKYSWIIPADQTASDMYRIVIWDPVNANGPQDASNDYFSIIKESNGQSSKPNLSLFLLKDINVCNITGMPCLNLKLTQTEINEIKIEIDKTLSDVYDWTNGAIDIQLEVIEIGATDINMTPWASGSYVSSWDAQPVIGSYVTKNTDFVMLTHGVRDIAQNLTMQISACGGTLGPDAGINGSGYIWIPKTSSGFQFECATRNTYGHEWLNLMDSVMEKVCKVNDIYTNSYPNCGAGDSDTYKWFPSASYDPTKDPNFAACGSTWSSYCGSVQPNDCELIWQKHILQTHYNPSTNLIGNHCRNNVKDFNETGVDTGGSCGY